MILLFLQMFASQRSKSEHIIVYQVQMCVLTTINKLVLIYKKYLLKYVKNYLACRCNFISLA